MSTKIDDLPGPIIDDYSSRQINEEQLNEYNSNQTNIKMDVKKRVHFKEPLEEINEIEEDHDNTSDISIIDYIKSQINEENLLIFIMLIIASRSDFDNYTTQIPFIGIYAQGSSIIVSIIKAIVLLLLYILSKKYLLPSVKL